MDKLVRVSVSVSSADANVVTRALEVLGRVGVGLLFEGIDAFVTVILEEEEADAKPAENP